jgi:predicted aconitase
MSLPRVALTAADRAMLDGDDGPARATAMRLIVAVAEAQEADRLIDVTAAHVDGCLYHGRAGLEFAERLASAGGRVRVPTTLNVASLDLLHPGLVRLDGERRDLARRLMDAHVAMGCEPTWTCAPYQLPRRPAFGEQIAWGESNAIVFANSVVGARTNRYGDFLDLCAALTGRVPDSGLHRTEGRRARVVFRMSGVRPRLLDQDVLYPVLGHLIGSAAETDVVVVDGLPDRIGEDRMKALGAAAASSGGIALVHVVGTTPEAATLADALQGLEPDRVVEVTIASLRAARDELSLAAGGVLTAISLGTPHYSIAEFDRLVRLLDGRTIHPSVSVHVSTSRHVLTGIEERGWADALRRAGVRLVTDTCTYVTPIIEAAGGVVMTDSAKWAYYAPGNLGVGVAFGSLEECILSAEAGRIVRQPEMWT